MIYDAEQLQVTLDRWLVREPARKSLDTPGAMVPAFLPLLTQEGAPLDHERFCVLALDRRLRVIDVAVLTSGTATASLMSPSQVLRWVLTRVEPSDRFVVAHNHPSGNPEPSADDIAVTRGLCKAARTVGLVCLDHLVIGGGGRYTSLAERGYTL